MSRPSGEDELGRVLFKMTSLAHRDLVFCCLGIMAGSAFAGSVMLSYGSANNRGTVLFEIALFGVAVLCGLAACGIVGTTLRLHERGVSRRSILGTRRLRYQDLHDIAITPCTSTLSINFVPVSRKPALELRFVPRPGLGLKPIVFLGRYDFMDDIRTVINQRSGFLLA